MKKKRAPLSFDTKEVIQDFTRSMGNEFKEKDDLQKQEKKKPKTSREGRQFIAAHVMSESSKQFKMLALQKDMTTQDLLIEAINDLFAKYNMSRIA